MHETQHPRTQLAWTRTGLSLAGVGAVEARLLAGDEPRGALLVLGAGLTLVLVLGAVAAVRLSRTRDALVVQRIPAGGRAPALVALMAMAVSLTALAVVGGGVALPSS